MIVFCAMFIKNLEFTETININVLFSDYNNLIIITSFLRFTFIITRNNLRYIAEMEHCPYLNKSSLLKIEKSYL